MYAECPNISLITDLLCTVGHASNEYDEDIRFLNTKIMSCFQKYVKFVTDVTLVIIKLPNLRTITVT